MPNGRVIDLGDALAGLERTELRADFHCVTTWSVQDLRWSGVRFSAFYDSRVRPLIERATPSIVFRAQDGYRTSLPLEDLLAEDVLLADAIDGAPLCIDHGAPLRLVAPRHYGYKSLKHLARIDVHSEDPAIERGVFAFLDHPRGRVAYEERGRWFPGWFLRRLYRPTIEGNVRRFRRQNPR